MPNNERVDMTHPSFPGEVFNVSRRAFPAHQLRGWVLATESPAQADEPPTSTEDVTPNASQED